MADASVTSPADMDPIQQASVAVAQTNIKSFGDAQLQILNLGLQEMYANSQRINAFNLQQMSASADISRAVTGKVIDMVLDKTASQVANATLDQVGAKIAQSTPPQTGQSDSTQLLQQIVSMFAAALATPVKA